MGDSYSLSSAGVPQKQPQPQFGGARWDSFKTKFRWLKPQISMPKMPKISMPKMQKPDKNILTWRGTVNNGVIENRDLEFNQLLYESKNPDEACAFLLACIAETTGKEHKATVEYALTRATKLPEAKHVFSILQAVSQEPALLKKDNRIHNMFKVLCRHVHTELNREDWKDSALKWGQEPINQWAKANPTGKNSLNTMLVQLQSPDTSSERFNKGTTALTTVLSHIAQAEEAAAQNQQTQQQDEDDNLHLTDGDETPPPPPGLTAGQVGQIAMSLLDIGSRQTDFLAALRQLHQTATNHNHMADNRVRTAFNRVLSTIESQLDAEPRSGRGLRYQSQPIHEAFNTDWQNYLKPMLTNLQQATNTDEYQQGCNQLVQVIQQLSQPAEAEDAEPVEAESPATTGGLSGRAEPPASSDSLPEAEANWIVQTLGGIGTTQTNGFKILLLLSKVATDTRCQNTPAVMQAFRTAIENIETEIQKPAYQNSPLSFNATSINHLPNEADAPNDFPMPKDLLQTTLTLLKSQPATQTYTNSCTVLEDFCQQLAPYCYRGPDEANMPTIEKTEISDDETNFSLTFTDGLHLDKNSHVSALSGKLRPWLGLETMPATQAGLITHYNQLVENPDNPFPLSEAQKGLLEAAFAILHDGCYDATGNLKTA